MPRPNQSIESNYSSRIGFSHISIEFGPTGNSTIRFADPVNLENQKLS